MAQGAKIGKSYENRPSNIILPKSKSLSVQTIKKWKDALTLAQLAENANRKPYIELCDSILLDSHLASVIESRVLKIKQSKFKLVDASGKSNPEINKLFEMPWFNSFIYHAIMAKFRGTSVVELWDLDPLTMQLANVNFIEQENLIPDKGLIVKENGDEKGYSYKEDPLKPYYIQIGKNKDLGILKDVAPDALTKKFAKASWSEFVEKYGIPPRWVTTDSYSESRENELADMMANMVSNHWAVLKGNEKIEVMNSTGSSSYEIFDKLIDRMNSEMTKRILGQDGTTDAGATGTYGSLKVMQGVSDDRHHADKTDIKDVINSDLLWRLQLISPVYGVLKNYTFDWDDSKEMTALELVDMVGKLSTAGFEVDTKFITDKTGIPIVGLKQDNAAVPPVDPGNQKKVSKLEARSFLQNEIVAFYSHKCNHEHDTLVAPPSPSGRAGVGIEAVELTNYTKLIEKVAKQLHEGTLKPSDLNSDLLTTILSDVRGAFSDGYGKDFSNYTESPAKKLSLNQNLYRFSAAKTYQELAKINLARQNNPNFADFKKEALKVNKEYNVQYLQTEFNTANRSGAMAEKWQKIEKQKDLYPNLTYKTVKDNRVREEHKNLQDITKPVDDPFWDGWYPPNGWACRCYVVQTDSEVTPGTPEGNPTPGFHGNVGKNDMVFNENEHPYFVFPAEDVEKISNSFENMKLAVPDYQLIYTKEKASVEASIWAHLNDYESNLKSAKIIVDKLGISVKIRPHVKIDKVKNPEYLINNRIGDLKEPEGYKGIKNVIKDSMEQYCSITVINFTLHFEKLYPNQVEGRLKNFFKNKIGIEELILIYDEKVLHLKKKDLIKIQKGESKELFDSWLK